MNNAVSISDVQLHPGDPKDEAEGLLGWVTCTLNGTLRLEGMTVRKTLDGDHALSFPSRLDHAGRKHFLYRPLSDSARREIEAQVFEQLGLEQEATP